MLNLAARFSSSFRSGPAPVSPQSASAGTRAAASGRATPLRERSVVIGPKAAFKAFVRAIVEAGRRLLGRSVQHIVPDAAARTLLRSSMSAIPPAAQQIVQREISDAVRREKPVYEDFTLRGADGQAGSTKVQDTLPKDLQRCRYTVGAGRSRREFDISHQTANGSPDRGRAVHEAIQALRDELGSDELLTAVSRFAHQGVAAGLLVAMHTKDSPVRDALGRPVSLVLPLDVSQSAPAESSSIAVEKLGDGCARVDLEWRVLKTSGLMPSQPDASASESQLTLLDPERSSARFSMSLMVTARATAQLLGPVKCEYQFTPLAAVPATSSPEPRQAIDPLAVRSAPQIASVEGSLQRATGEGPQLAQAGREEATVKQAIEALLSECLGADPKAHKGRAATADFLSVLVRAQLKEAGPAEHPERVLRGSVERAREEFEALIDDVADSSMLDRACAAAMRRIGIGDSATADDWIAAVTDEVAAVRNKASLADAAEAELRAAIGRMAGAAGAAGSDWLKAMARFVAERISTAPASVSANSMKPAVDEAVRLLQEFTATERLHPTQRQEEAGPSKQIESHFERMQIAARDGRFEARLATLRQDLAKQVIRRMVSVGASGQPGAPESWLRKLLKEERPTVLPSEPVTKPAVTDAGRIEAAAPTLRAQRRLLQQSGDLTSLLRKIDREIAPAMMSRLALAMDAQPTRPLHELVAESEASLREAALACLPQSPQEVAA